LIIINSALEVTCKRIRELKIVDGNLIENRIWGEKYKEPSGEKLR
jgi:hypothetical protein